ncbi:type II toxin-antitoxin system PemK/MazF family toxin [Deferrisoma camini]|uniref:type II toxin-antitoxin system PemK/MazF family toxin n=1 Tax=Deferrisoma camini TaxID=1035120 RepID=UPI0004A45E75|nr:type II toxin-antitoxin system PemK/MazF family toxin [Deferrisoma camini]
MTDFEFGDVVLVPFPFTDQKAIKKRPAVVVSSRAYHLARADLIILAVTSQVRPSSTVGEAPLVKWREAGLLKPSVFKPLIATIDKQLVLRKLGHLSDSDQRQLKAVLRHILGA